MKKLKWWHWTLIALVVIGVLGNIGKKDTSAPTAPDSASATELSESKPPAAATPAPPSNEDGDTPTEFRKGGLVLLKKTMKVEKNSMGGFITGIVENRTGRDLTYAQIEFAAFDKDGNQVTTGIANASKLDTGAKWKFKAAVLDDGFATVKFKDLTGF